MQYSLNNEFITIKINRFGAELSSIMNNKTNQEYLWNGDPKFWKRQAPILFPFVGSSKDKGYTYEGKTYPMAQHGFARDMEFDLIRSSENEIWFGLNWNEESLKRYPFHFTLELGYRLVNNRVDVLWKVINQGEEIMYFSIGGHPAFNCPLKPEEQRDEYYLDFHTEKSIDYLLVNMENGLEVKSSPNAHHKLITEHGIHPITPHMFDKDALIIEDKQCNKISLLTPDKTPYITLHFDTPLVGIWSPAGTVAPFICIEPWYGRCDSEDFVGSLEDKDYINRLEPKEQFVGGYQIELL